MFLQSPCGEDTARPFAKAIRYGYFLLSTFYFSPSTLPLPSHRILGLDFFGGTSREAVAEITRTGGLLVAPAAPSMINLCRDPDYRRALLASDLAIADSGFMVLLWKLFTGERVPRISGLEHVKRLLEHESVREPGAVLWVVATETSRQKLQAFLAGGTTSVSSVDQISGSTESSPTDRPQEDRRQKREIGGQTTGEGSFQSGERTRLACSDRRPADQHAGSEETIEAAESSPQRDAVASTRGRARSPEIYIAPRYSRPVADEALLTLVRQERPRHIVIAVGGGIQDQLGLYLLENLDYRPAIHCIGAAIGFLTGDQVRIPNWADKYYVGWLLRSFAQPRVFIPRFWSARRLPALIAKYRDRLPPLEK